MFKLNKKKRRKDQNDWKELSQLRNEAGHKHKLQTQGRGVGVQGNILFLTQPKPKFQKAKKAKSIMGRGKNQNTQNAKRKLTQAWNSRARQDSSVHDMTWCRETDDKKTPSEIHMVTRQWHTGRNERRGADDQTIKRWRETANKTRN